MLDKDKYKSFNIYGYYFYSVSLLVLFLSVEGLTIFVAFRKSSLHLPLRLEFFAWLLPIFAAMPLIDGFRAYRQIKTFFLSHGIDEAAMSQIRYPLLAALVHCYVAICGILTILLIAILSRQI